MQGGTSEGAKKGWTEERKRIQSERWKNKEFNPSVGRPKGCKNKNPYPMTQAVIDKLDILVEKTRQRFAKMTPEERYNYCSTNFGSDPEIVKRCRDNLGNRKAGMSRHYYSGKFKPKNPNKYVGDITNIIYRSFLEFKTMRYIDNDPNIVTWRSEEVIIPYLHPVHGEMRRYFPDFIITLKDGTTQVIEIKPKYQCVPPILPKHGRVTNFYRESVKTYAVNQAKWEAATKYCEKLGWKFGVLTEDDLGIIYNNKHKPLHNV